MKTKGLSREQLKLLAVIAMVVDHTAWGFVDFMSPLGQVMHLFGRLTMPIMCFFVAEGYRHTRSVRRYLYRMAGFALVSIIPFYIFFHEEYYYRQNIIFDLTLALLALAVSQYKKFNKAVRSILVCLIFAVSVSVGGWVVMPILYVFVFYYGKDFKSKAFWFIFVTLLMQAVLLPLIILNQSYHFSKYNWTVSERLYLFGFVIALIPLYFYNGKKGKDIFGRYFFYLFYPGHFLVLSFIRYMMNDFTAQSFYIYAHVAALFIGLGLLLFVMTRPVSRAQMAVTFLMTVSTMYIFGFLLEITTFEAEGVFTATKLQYFAECLVFMAATLCMEELCHIRIPRPIYAAEGVITVLVTYCLFTYKQNGLMYKDISINYDGPFPRMEIVAYGPVFYAFIGYCALVCALWVIVALRSGDRRDEIQKKRLRLLLYAVISMWLPYLVKAFGLAGGYEIPALFIPLSALFLVLALVKYSYLDSAKLDFTNAVQHGTEGILIIDNRHRVLYNNDWMHDLFGRFSRYDDAFRIPGVEDAFSGKTETMTKNGRTYEFRVEPLIEQGHTTGRILWGVDLTEHIMHLSQIEERSIRDSLTGLHNRHWFEDRMQELIAEKARGAYIMADLDHFKDVNDRYGHQVGDEVLCAFAETIHRAGRGIRSSGSERESIKRLPSEGMLSSRFGGDEFCLFLKNETDREYLDSFAKELIDGFDEVLFEKGRGGLTALSLGITIMDGNDMPDTVSAAYAQIYNQADQALYNAKKAGRRTWKYYSRPLG